MKKAPAKLRRSRPTSIEGGTIVAFEISASDLEWLDSESERRSAIPEIDALKRSRAGVLRDCVDYFRRMMEASGPKDEINERPLYRF